MVGDGQCCIQKFLQERGSFAPFSHSNASQMVIHVSPWTLWAGSLPAHMYLYMCMYTSPPWHGCTASAASCDTYVRIHQSKFMILFDTMFDLWLSYIQSIDSQERTLSSLYVHKCYVCVYIMHSSIVWHMQCVQEWRWELWRCESSAGQEECPYHGQGECSEHEWSHGCTLNSQYPPLESLDRN